VRLALVSLSTKQPALLPLQSQLTHQLLLCFVGVAVEVAGVKIPKAEAEGQALHVLLDF
jgi:hypothetical protein